MNERINRFMQSIMDAVERNLSVQIAHALIPAKEKSAPIEMICP
jgi:hypothetical protein